MTNWERAIRLTNRQEKLHLSSEQTESLLEEAEVHCFKRGIETKEFIKQVGDVCNLSSESKIPVEELSSDIKKKKDELFSLNMEIISKNAEMEKETEKALLKHNVTMKQLRDFVMNRPAIGRLQISERNLAVVTAQRNDAYMEIYRLTKQRNDAYMEIYRLTKQRNDAYMEICRLLEKLTFEEYAKKLQNVNDTADYKSGP